MKGVNCMFEHFKKGFGETAGRIIGGLATYLVVGALLSSKSNKKENNNSKTE